MYPDLRIRQGILTRQSPAPSATAAHFAVDLPLGFPVLCGLALVVGLLAATDTNLDLDLPLLIEIDLQGHDGQTFFLHLDAQLICFSLVNQKLPFASRLMIGVSAMAVFRDAYLVHESLARLNADKTIDHFTLACTKTLDLGALQDNSCLQSVKDLQFEASPSILGHHLHRIDSFLAAKITPE